MTRLGIIEMLATAEPLPVQRCIILAVSSPGEQAGFEPSVVQD